MCFSLWASKQFLHLLQNFLKANTPERGKGSGTWLRDSCWRKSGSRIHCYEKLLKTIAKGDSAWVTLPRDLCEWWNQRDAKVLSLWAKATENDVPETP